MLTGAVASANPAVEALRGQGPADGEFSAWTKKMDLLPIQGWIHR